MAAIGLAVLAACSGSSVPSGQDGADNRAAAVTQAPGTPAARPFKAQEKSDLLEFEYSYPAEAAAVPAVAARLDEEMRSGKADALKMAQEDQASAKQSGYPFRPHSLQTDWKVHARTPRFLSLLGESYVYTGGAHGMTGYSALLWDEDKGHEASFAAMMTSPAAFSEAIHDRFCDALDAERAKKRGEPIKRGAADDSFTQCVDPLKQVLVPESTDGRSVDRITVVIGPYEAGPYAEGSYEIPLPVDTAMLNAIKPDYRSAFSAGR